MRGIGIDLVEISRFERFANDSEAAFLKKVFSAREIGYCFGYKDFAPRLAGTFAAKEAASKALGVDRFPFAELEIRRTKKGAPEVWRKGKRLSVKVSITHTDSIAAAIAAR